MPAINVFESGGLAWALGRLAHGCDADVWPRLVEQAGPDIHRLAWRLVGDHALAEDVVQETFLLIRDHAARFAVHSANADEDARRWILGIAANVSRQIVRRHSRQRRRESAMASQGIHGRPSMAEPGKELEAHEQGQLLRRELAELPDLYCRALTLYFFAGLDYLTLAADLRVSVNVVRNRIHRGLRFLRERLQRRGVTMSLVTVTTALTTLATAPVAEAALPAATLGIINSSAAATTTMGSATLTMAGGVVVPAVLVALLAITVTWLGWSLRWQPDAADVTHMPMIGAEFAAAVPPADEHTPPPQVDADAVEPMPSAPFKMVVKTNQQTQRKHEQSLLSPSGDHQFTLPLRMDYSYNFTVDWGDGTREVITRSMSDDLVHALERQVALPQASGGDLTGIQRLNNVLAHLAHDLPVAVILDPEMDRQTEASIDKSADYVLDYNADLVQLRTVKSPVRQVVMTISDLLGLIPIIDQRHTSIVLTNRSVFSQQHVVTHSYAQPGTYQVAISENAVGGYPAIHFNGTGDCHKVLEIAQWGGGTWRCLHRAFAGCENLTISAMDGETALTGQVIDFSGAWSGCFRLKNFPLLNTSAGIFFQKAWSGCFRLTNFPLLNTGQATTLEGAWDGCSGLKDFPPLNTASVWNFSDSWSDCTGLSSFPLLNTAAGKIFRCTWKGCAGLTSFPLLDTGAGVDFSGAWLECSGLTDFPLLDTSSGMAFHETWLMCRGLRNFPPLNTSVGDDFEFAWKNCSALSSFPPLDISKATSLLSTWEGCSNLTSFPQLNTTAVTDFTGAWKDCSRLANFPSLNMGAGREFVCTWQGCSGLKEFPLIDTSKGRDFAMAWHGCSGLTSFPLLNFVAGTGFYETWSGCFGLTSFPMIQVAGVTDLSGTWTGCAGLMSFPQLNTAAVTSFSRTWEGCVKLTVFPDLDFGGMTNGENCFSGVTLEPESYAALLAGLLKRNKHANVVFDAGMSIPRGPGSEAKAALTTKRGWTIYDAQTAKPVPKPRADRGPIYRQPPKCRRRMSSSRQVLSRSFLIGIQLDPRQPHVLDGQVKCQVIRSKKSRQRWRRPASPAAEAPGDVTVSGLKSPRDDARFASVSTPAFSCHR